MSTTEENHKLLLPEFEKVTDRYTDTTIINGNSLTLLPSGVSSYEMRWKLIDNARHHIHINQYLKYKT